MNNTVIPLVCVGNRGYGMHYGCFSKDISMVRGLMDKNYWRCGAVAITVWVGSTTEDETRTEREEQLG